MLMKGAGHSSEPFFYSQTVGVAIRILKNQYRITTDTPIHLSQDMNAMLSNDEKENSYLEFYDGLDHWSTDGTITGSNDSGKSSGSGLGNFVTGRTRCNTE